MGISVLRGVGWVPQKSAGFGATAPAQSIPDPVAAPKNIPFGTIFIEFGDTKKCCTFSGLELAPKSRKKLIGALSCMHKGPKCIQSLWHNPKKIPFVQKHKEGAICAILREKTPFLAFQEGKKGVVDCARLRKAAHWPNNNANPSGLSGKKVYCVEKARYVRSLGKKPHFWPSQRLKKVLLTEQGCARLRTGLIIMQIPRGYQKKKFIVLKSAICAILREKTPFLAFPEAKKGVVD